MLASRLARFAREPFIHFLLLGSAVLSVSHYETGRVLPVGNTVDLKTATYTNTIGVTELGGVWQDPAFDAQTPVVYYLRVLEIPTPRWSTIVSVKRGLPLPEGVPPTIQERGWSSPIWFDLPARCAARGEN